MGLWSRGKASSHKSIDLRSFLISNFRAWRRTSRWGAYLNPLWSKRNCKERIYSKKSISRTSSDFECWNRHYELPSSKETIHPIWRKIKIWIYSSAYALWRIYWKYYFLWRWWSSIYLVYSICYYKLPTSLQNSQYINWN